jgi:ATP adenylyltransferase
VPPENEQHPWRSQKIDRYLEHHTPPGSDGTIFTRILHANEDERYFVLYRGSRFAVTLSRRPYNNGHLLVFPCRPVRGFRELTPGEQNDLADLLDRATGWLREGLGAEGVNIAMNEGDFAESGELEHLHVHVVPRWYGDTNFMAAVNDLKVIPESLDRTYERLRRHIERSPG